MTAAMEKLRVLLLLSRSTLAYVKLVCDRSTNSRSDLFGSGAVGGNATISVVRCGVVPPDLRCDLIHTRF
jgi:hypothetical protein